MAGAEEALDVEALGRDQRAQRGLDGLEHREEREVFHALLLRRQHGGGRSGRGRLKADAEEHDLFIRVFPGKLHRVHGRVHDLDPRAERAAA